MPDIRESELAAEMAVGMAVIQDEVVKDRNRVLEAGSTPALRGGNYRLLNVYPENGASSTFSGLPTVSLTWANLINSPLTL